MSAFTKAEEVVHGEIDLNKSEDLIELADYVHEGWGYEEMPRIRITPSVDNLIMYVKLFRDRSYTTLKAGEKKTE